VAENKFEKFATMSDDDHQNPNEPVVNAVAIKLSKFWPKNVSTWFQRVEGQFRIAKITTEQTKFDHLLQVLDEDVADKVIDVLDNLPEENKYTALKEEILRRCTPTPFDRAQKLLALQPLGDGDPEKLQTEIERLCRGIDIEMVKRPYF